MIETDGFVILERSNIMKRFLTVFFTALLLTAALCVTASASDYDAVAGDLSAIGMFRGTANGFELDRAPKRSEAAIMLVRLYGAEEEAKAAYDAGEISHPFTDVSEFTSPYVAWLYNKGITKGATATTFGSAGTCSAKMYCAFLLRALGYEDGVDFQYADTLAFAQQKGFYDPTIFAGDFLRDDLAALTYQGLAADLKDGSTYLLDSLVRSGAVDAEAAKPMTEKIEAYRAMTAAMNTVDSNAMDVDMDMRMDMTVTAEGETMQVPSTMQGNMKMIVAENGSIQMAYTMETTSEGTSVDMDVWMKDGWVYLSTEADGTAMKLKYSVEDQLAAVESLGAVNMDAMSVSGLAMLESVTAKTSGGNTEYTIVIGEGVNGLLENVLGMMGQDAGSMDMRLGKMTATYTVDSKGNMKKVDMTFTASVKMDVPMEDGQSYSMAADYDYDMSMTVNATGKDVKVTFPDFSDFQEIDPSQMAA